MTLREALAHYEAGKKIIRLADLGFHTPYQRDEPMWLPIDKEALLATDWVVVSLLPRSMRNSGSVYSVDAE